MTPQSGMTQTERDAFVYGILQHVQAFINRSVAQTLRRQRERDAGSPA
jgi:hypothetical protein